MNRRDEPKSRETGQRGLDPVTGMGRARDHALIVGKSALEREGVARSVHRQRRGQDGLFLRLRCPQDNELLEHALERWMRRPEGEDPPRLLARLDGGSLFLDSIEDLAPSAQRLLLEFLQLEPSAEAGHGAPVATWKGQFIAGSARSLRQAVRDGGFDSELADRLDAVRIVLDPEEDEERR